MAKKRLCVTCAMRGVEKKATDVVRLQGMWISVCDECLERLRPERVVLRTLMTAVLDDLIAKDLTPILLKEEKNEKDPHIV